jgi:ADP-ribose pyrophosphatase YjhB (NUDIX family)
VFYDNPRIIVGCLVEDRGRLLLCKRAIKPRFGLWNLPAGFLENGERVEQGAVRETLEESKAQVEILKLHAVFSLPQVNQVYLHFVAKLAGGQIGPTPESAEVRFFEPKEIPWTDIAFHSTTFALEKFLEHGKDYEGVHLGSHDKRETW